MMWVAENIQACLRIFRQASSLTWLSIRIGLQGRKPRESNKLFDLFYRRRMGRFIPVYRLGEDGDLSYRRWWYAFGLGVKSSLL